MRIQAISCNNLYFKANHREVYNKHKKCSYRTTTDFFRSDTDWYALENYLCDKYKNCDKVNVVCHACSNGMEPYSFLMHMMAYHSTDVSKFTPIIARDIDELNIDMAKKGEYIIDKDSLLNIDYNTKNMAATYIDTNAPIKNFYINCKIKDDVKSMIDFQQSDIFDDIENLPDKNVVLFCKNFWAYLSQSQQRELVRKLSAKLDESSVLIVGSYDKLCDINGLLNEFGFVRHPHIDCIYEKKSNYKTPNN